MKRSEPVNGRIGHWWLATLAALLVAGGVSAGAAAASQQATYKSPQEAVDALVAAVKAGGNDGIIAVLGDKGRELASSGDAVADA
ncbi:MAG: DUF2950 family protein, partial [Hyphomicrobium sp.]